MARFDGGWVKVHRRVVEEDIGQRGNFTLGLFVRLLRMANWRDGSSLLGRQRVRLKPGQIATSLRELSPDIDEDPHLNRVRNALAYLEKRGTIAQESNNQGRLITVLNWDTYQFSEADPTGEPQANHRQTTGGPQHSEEDKKERSKNIDWFGSALAEYKKLPGVKKGPKAEQRFGEQIKSESDLESLLSAIKNYSEFLSRSENSWRKPKTTFDTFLGSKSSGYFWRDFIQNESQTPKQAKALGTLEDLIGGQKNAS